MLSPANAAACKTMLACWPTSGNAGRNPAVSTVTVSLWVNLFKNLVMLKKEQIALCLELYTISSLLLKARYSLSVLKVPLNSNQSISGLSMCMLHRKCFWLWRWCSFIIAFNYFEPFSCWRWNLMLCLQSPVFLLLPWFNEAVVHTCHWCNIEKFICM